VVFPAPGELTYDAGSCSVLPLTAVLAAWGNAWLAGRCGVEDAALAAGRGALVETPHGDLRSLLLRMRADGASELRVVLPAPGDVRGLPTGGDFAGHAVDAGNGLVVVGARCGLVARVEQRGNALEGTTAVDILDAHECGEPMAWAMDVAEAGQLLRDTAREVTAQLRELELIAPGGAGPIALRGVRRAELPPGTPSSAVALADQTDRFAAALERITAAGSGARTVWEDQQRVEALRRLTAAVRQARAAAWNSRVRG
jgi:hypothetical protein